MRSAVLTVALLPISCLHEPTSLQVNEESLVMSRFGHPQPVLVVTRAAGDGPDPRIAASTVLRVHEQPLVP
jgi:hypothetical protein